MRLVDGEQRRLMRWRCATNQLETTALEKIEVERKGDEEKWDGWKEREK